MGRMFKVVVVLAVVAGVATACQTVPAQPGYKPLLVGLIDKGNAAPFQVGQPFPVIDLSNEVGSSPGLAGVVVNVSWSQLEPTQGTFDFSTLDASLSAVQTYDNQHSKAQLGVRLRGFGADDVPTRQEPEWHTNQHHRQRTKSWHRWPVVEAGLPVGMGRLPTGARPALRQQPLGARGRRRLLRVTHRRAVHHGHHKQRQDPAAGRRMERHGPASLPRRGPQRHAPWRHTASTTRSTPSPP